MRESIGGTMLFWIVLFFMAIFIGFMACIIHYARVYKIKNSVINYIERSEGIKTEEEFRSVLTQYGYPIDDPYVICRCHPGERGGYYLVKLYAMFNMPFVPGAITVEIRGETSNIFTGVLVNDDGTNGSMLFSDVNVADQCFSYNTKEYANCSDAAS